MANNSIIAERLKGSFFSLVIIFNYMVRRETKRVVRRKVAPPYGVKIISPPTS